MEQLRVLTTKGYQVVMSAVLDHPPMIENVDPISGAHRGEPMRNDQGAAPPQYLVQGGEQLVLRPGIKGCGRFIDDQQRGAAIERAGDRHLLPLPAGELVSAGKAPGQRSLIASRERTEERVGVRDLGRL